MPIYGVDISAYQKGIDVSRVQAEGFQFLIARCWRGQLRQPDSEFHRFRQACQRIGMRFMAYHYIGGDYPADQQVEDCIGHLGDPSIPVMLDWENGSGGVGQLRRVHEAFTARGVRVALTYAPRWYWQQQGSPSLTGLPPLTASHYAAGTRTDVASRLYQAAARSVHWNGYGGNTTAVLQFTDRAQVAGMRIDANAFRGTTAELDTLFGPDTNDGFTDQDRAKLDTILHMTTGSGTAQPAKRQTFEHDQWVTVLPVEVGDGTT